MPLPRPLAHPRCAAAALAALLLMGCQAGIGTPGISGTPGAQGPFAPGINPNEQAVDGLVVGHRLMDAGEYELALQAFARAAGQQGGQLNLEVLLGMGSANLGLGRLGQAEALLRQAIAKDGQQPTAWNNLGVVLNEQGKYAEAAETFKRAYALDNGASDAIRDNLRKAMEKLDDPGYTEDYAPEYSLVRGGRDSYLIRRAM